MTEAFVAIKLSNAEWLAKFVLDLNGLESFELYVERLPLKRIRFNSVFFQVQLKLPDSCLLAILDAN